MTPAPTPDPQPKTNSVPEIQVAKGLARMGYGWEDIAIKCDVSKQMARIIVMMGK
jgi:hypothetical protein